MATTLLITLVVANMIVWSSGCQLMKSTLRSNQTTGVLISSSGYPESGYRNYEEKCWLFIVDSGTISIRAKDVLIERCCDKVTIYDGLNENATRIGSMQGMEHGLGIPIVTSGQFLFVKFKSDFSVTGPGFQACVCTANPTCSCPYIDSSSMWSNWESWNDWDENEEWFGGRREYEDELSNGAKAAIGISVILLICIPIVIGVTVAYCCGEKCKKTTQSPNAYAERRIRENKFATSFKDINNRAENELCRDRKHNQVRPWVVPCPPGYPTLTQPPAYPGQMAVYSSPHDMLMTPPSYLLAAGAPKRVLLPPLVTHGTPLISDDVHTNTQASFVTQASETAPLNTSDPVNPSANDNDLPTKE